MNPSAKTENVNIRVNPATKAALVCYAKVSAGGSVSRVIHRLIAEALADFAGYKK